MGGVSQSEMKLNPTGPLEWEQSDRWGLLSKCGRFAVSSQTVAGKTEHVLWARGADGRHIPKWLGAFDTIEDAKSEAEERKYGETPKRDGIFDWKPRWPKR